MGYLPIFLDVIGHPCIVVGGGRVAGRKARSLIDAGANVTVVSPAISAALGAMVEGGEVRHIGRAYVRGDLRGFTLAYVATGDHMVACEVAAEARELGIPVNVADMPQLCSFIAPSVVRRGDLQIAISTGGSSPAIAAMLRNELEAHFGPEHGLLIEVMKAVRRRLRECEPNGDARARALIALASSELRGQLKEHDYAAADELLFSHLGVRMAELGIDPLRTTLPAADADISPE
jgi:precorrin-2 dehydrogenase / sirohydrochlorin ferrochelatase